MERRALIAGAADEIRREVARRLDSLGIPFEEAVNAQEALAAPASNMFDLIVLAPLDRDPLVLARELRASPTLTTAYMLALSAPPPGESAQWLDAGINDFLDAEATADSLDRRLSVALRTLVTQRAMTLPADEVASRMRLADRMATIGQLAAGIGHELNTPLSYVLLNLESAYRALSQVVPPDRSPDGATDALEAALEGCERMRAIVADIRVFAKRDATPPKPVDVCALIDTALRLSRSQLQLHSVEVQRRFVQRPRVLAREPEFVQIMTNLIINAAQAIPKDREGLLTITTDRSEDGNVEILVSDNGIGIPEANKAKLFQPFFTTKGRDGTGIGLAICHRIITSYGGSISLESQPEQGTDIRITLPGIASATDNAPASSRILIAEDDVSLARTLAKSLAAHQVTVVNNGEKAIEALSSGEAFDFILCDLVMPRLDGLEVLKWIRNEHPELAKRFVLMTGGALSAVMTESLEDQDLTILYKPFALEQLLTLVAQVTGRLSKSR